MTESVICACTVENYQNDDVARLNSEQANKLLAQQQCVVDNPRTTAGR